MNVRVQSTGNIVLTLATPTDKVVNKGLVKITKVCDILSDKFQNALSDYYNNAANSMK